MSLLFIIVIISCSAQRIQGVSKPVSIKELKFINEYIIPHNLQFKGTTVGGLSGIDYNTKENLYYIISDDRAFINPVRFYKAKIFLTSKGIDSIAFVDVVNLLQENGTYYPNERQNAALSPDPEALRYNAREKSLVWTSEGERLVTKEKIVLQDPAIRIINKKGRNADSFPLPFQTHMYAKENGLRRNATFEGLCFADNFKSLFISIEEALYEDGPRANVQDSAYIRVLKYNSKKKRPLAQYPYRVDPVVRIPEPSTGQIINGVTDIVSLSKNKLLFVERSFSAGRAGCNIRIYEGDILQASDISQMPSLKNKTFIPIPKKLIINMDALNMYIGNIEGVTFGPKLSNGHSSLIFVSDNNFRETEKTQFLLFEIIP